MDRLINFFNDNNDNIDTLKYLAEEYQIPLDIDLYKQKINGVLPPEIVDNVNAYIEQYQPVIEFGLKKFKLTALLSKITPDDISFENFLKTPEGIKAGKRSLPRTYNLTSILLPIRDQGGTNCCVAFSTATAIEYKNIITKKYLYYLSPAFIYNNRADTTKDVGMNSQGAINIVKKIGVATDKIFPMEMLNKSIQPKIYDNALEYKITDSFYITSLSDLKIALFTTGPIIAILPVYEGVDINIFWKKSNIKTIGHHCIAIVGYDDLSERLIIRNSWGTNWAINGYQWFPYSDFNIIVEAWTLLPIASNPIESLYLSTNIDDNNETDISKQIFGLDPVVFYSLLAGIIVFIILIIIVIIIRYRQQNNNK